MSVLSSLPRRIAFALKHRTLSRKVETSSKLLVYHEGKTVALKLRCPHQGAPLVDGYFERGALVCPWHGCRFGLDGKPESSGDRVHY